MFLSFFAQILPPTPTPLPPGNPPDLSALENLPTMWDIAPEAVGLWNQFGDYTPYLQYLIIGILVLRLIFLIINLIKRAGTAATTNAPTVGED